MIPVFTFRLRSPIVEVKRTNRAYADLRTRREIAKTDPHPENRRAIRAYEKAGFKVASQPMDTRWGAPF